jgi:hypothetical protein
MSVSSSVPTSIATASKTSPGGASRATSVATRRSAACSFASRARASRDSAFEIAVEMSSVKSSSRCSVPAGSGSAPFAATEMWPQTLPSTTIGEPAAARIDESCMAAATAPPRLE